MTVGLWTSRDLQPHDFKNTLSALKPLIPTMRPPKKVLALLSIAAIVQLYGASAVAAEKLSNRTGKQWAPFLEWNLKNPSCDGNPFDLVAAATFVHAKSSARCATEMFFAGDDTWRFRFTGTRPGLWTFTTASSDADLDDRHGSVTIEANDDSYGMVTGAGSKWARQRGRNGDLTAFVPQFVMYGHPGTFHEQPNKIDTDIGTFISEHGFTGFHVPVQCRWFQIEHDRSSSIKSGDPDPDRRTFAALELVITRVHAAGGVVHLWAWGDESRRQTPVKWGINGKADKRLQRYIAARLGPLPGWTMGYGFDLDEWVSERQLGQWRDYLHQHLGWPHLLGGRHADPNHGLDHSTAISWNRRMDYASYEHHRPTHEVYVAAVRAVPNKPVFSEDRFRIRQSERYRGKDYTEATTRRGLWHSTMAGGVANIWGKLDGDLGINKGLGMSKRYDNPHWIKTWSVFFRGRFQLDSEPARGLSNGLSLRSRGSGHWVFYREDTDSIEMDLSAATGEQPAIAVDTKKPYKEINLGRLTPPKASWRAPYDSDWAIAVGEPVDPN